jgi:methyl-accepting chemotaxis protein
MAEEILDTIKSNNASYIQSYSERTMSTDEKQAFDEFLSLLNEYTTEQSKLFDLLDNGNYIEAKNARSEITVITDSMNEKLNNLISINQELAKEANDSNNGLYHDK